MKIKLIPKTHKAKNRIREHGEFWLVQKEGTIIGQFVETLPSDNEMFLVIPFPSEIEMELGPSYMRWVNKKNDPDFDWVEVEDEELAAAIQEYKEKGKEFAN